MKRLVSLLTLVVMLLSLLAACGGGSGPSQPAANQAATPAPATEAPAETEDEEPTEAPAETEDEEPTEATEDEEPTEETADTPSGEIPEDPIGVIEVKPGDPIVLGYGLLTSGPNSNLGIDSMRGVEIALDDVGGEVMGHEISLVGEDTGCSPEGGQAAANKLISNEQIVGIIGSTCSSAGNVMAPVIDEAGMVMISPSNTAPNLTDPETHVEGYLRTAHNDKIQGSVAAEFAYNELGLTTAATVHDGSVYAEQLANVFADKFEELGGEVVTQEAVNETDTDMRPVLTTIATEEPEILYYPIFMPAGGFMTRQAREVTGLEDVVLMGADGLFNPDYIEAAGDAVIGMYLSSPDLTSFGGGYQDFLDKHMEKYNEETLSVYHANAYDATMLIIKAVEEVAVEGDDGTLYIPRQGIRTALYGMEYEGLTGNLMCDENGDCADPKIVVYEITDPDPDTWNPGDPTQDPDANPRKVYPMGDAEEADADAEEADADAEEADADAEEADADAEADAVADDEVRNPEADEDIEEFWNQFDWADLSAAEKELWDTLGWDEMSWDEEENTPESDELMWEELSEEEQMAAEVLGFDQENWDATAPGADTDEDMTDEDMTDEDMTDEDMTDEEADAEPVEEVNNEGGFAVMPLEGWTVASFGDETGGATVLSPEDPTTGEAMIMLSSGPIADIPIEDVEEVTADDLIDAVGSEADGPAVADEREDIEIDGVEGRAAVITMEQDGQEFEGVMAFVILDEERAFTAMGMAPADSWDSDMFDEILASIRFFEPGSEEVVDEEATDEEMTDEEATDEEMTDEEATDEEMTDEEATDEEMTDEEATDEEMTDEEVAEDEISIVAEPPEDDLGVIEVAEGDPIVIGYALVTSGPNSNLGIDSMRGIEIAMEDIGGEILGHEISLVGEDTGCSPEGGQAAANKLISNDEIVGIVGSTCSSAGNVMAPVIDESGMIMISPSNTAPSLTDPETHVEGYLRTAHNDKIQGSVAAEFAYNELGLTTAATIHDGSVYAEQLANVFAETFEELGGEIVTQEAVNETDTDMRPVLTTIAAVEPDVIYYPIFMPAGGFMTRQAREVTGLEDVVLMGADGLFNPDYIEAAGDAVIGMYLSSPDLTSLGSTYQDFLDKHMEKYNEDTLSVYHANAYDATMLILNAIEEAAVMDEDGTLYIPRQAVRDALYATEDFEGLTGSLTCDEYGDCADPKIVVYEIADSDPDTWSPGEDTDSNPMKVYP